MKICLFCFSAAGADLAERLCRRLEIPNACVHTTEKFAAAHGFTAHGRVGEDMGGLFCENDALIFIGACGIAVREIAPHLGSKATDPAVLVIDDGGKYVIPILSGHIGGANRLARKIAADIGAVAAVTTSTDGAGKFSADAWAAEHGFAISSLQRAKEISAAVLAHDVPICAERPLPETLPHGLVRGERGECGIYIGVYEKAPFDETLRLVPRALVLGVGCRRGTSAACIKAAVENVFAEHRLDLFAVSEIATIDIKKDEAGLSAFAAACGVPTVFYTTEELCAVRGDFTESAFVRQTVGVGNVCERAAVLAGGRLLVRKTAAHGVTVAVSEKEWGIDF